MNRDTTLVVIDGVRTPFCKIGTALASLSADELGRQVVQTLLTRTGIDPAMVDEVLFGCVAQPAEATNIARVIGLRAGLPVSVPAMTVQRNCASGFEAITTAQERMRSDRGSIFIVGGVESMSQIPMILSPEAGEKVHAVNRARTTMETVAALAAFRPHDLRPEAGLMLGLTDPVSGLNMGQTAELLAREMGISREAQDAFALRSQQKAAAAREKRAEEIAPVYLPEGKEAGRVVTEDNGPRPDASPDGLAGLRPVFEPALGSVTAGNSSQISDGAVALLVMTAEKADELGLEPLGRLVDYAYTGCDPARMGLGPVAAIRTLRRRGFHPAEADRVE
ncbi:MAG TPA: thiolase family protein, partial [Chthoniobacteraceae bacterium]|nr:thiolase family protein [Chthoniobacteraceae bacterium]